MEDRFQSRVYGIFREKLKREGQRKEKSGRRLERDSQEFV
jgi:hypothetical protein